MNIRQKLVITLITLIMPVGVFALDGKDYPGVPLVVVKESPLILSYYDRAPWKNIPAGEKVLGEMGTKLHKLPHHENNYYTIIRYEDHECYVYSNSLVPESGDTLPESWITTTDEFAKRWVISYFLDVLHSKDRDTFSKYAKAYVDYLKQSVLDGLPSNIPWEEADWWFSFFVRESLIFSASSISMGGLDQGGGWNTTFFIRKIVPVNNGYGITLEGDWFAAVYGEKVGGLPFPKYEDRRTFDLIFIPDGDYMDVYLDSLDTKFATFAKVDPIFLVEMQNLLDTNTCDLTNIVWPRRADGSMDYPLPQLAQAVPKQPETAAIDTPQTEYEDAAGVTSTGETVAQQPGTALPLVIVLAALGIAVTAGIAVFLIRRKR
jgi:hypothetical protein